MEIKRGDLILLYYRFDPIAWLIRRKTHSKWNHIGVALHGTKIIDLRATKLRYAKISRFTKSCIYKIKILRIKNLTPEIREHLINTLAKQSEIRHYFKMLWKFFLMFFNIPTDICLSCSEVIAQALREKNIDICSGKDVRLITPEDFNKSKEVYHVS